MPWLLQMRAVADAGQLQDFRRGERAGGEHHFPARPEGDAVLEPHAGRAKTLEQHLVDAHAGHDSEIAAAFRRAQKGFGGRFGAGRRSVVVW